MRTQQVSVMVFKPSGKWVVGGPDEDFNPLVVTVPFDDNIERVWNGAVEKLLPDYGEDYHYLILSTPGHPHDHPALRLVDGGLVCTQHLREAIHDAERDLKEQRDRYKAAAERSDTKRAAALELVRSALDQVVLEGHDPVEVWKKLHEAIPLLQ